MSERMTPEREAALRRAGLETPEYCGGVTEVFAELDAVRAELARVQSVNVDLMRARGGKPLAMSMGPIVPAASRPSDEVEALRADVADLVRVRDELRDLLVKGQDALTAATTRAEVAEREVRTATAVLDETRLRMAPLLAALTAAQADLSSARGTAGPGSVIPHASDITTKAELLRRLVRTVDDYGGGPFDSLKMALEHVCDDVLFAATAKAAPEADAPRGAARVMVFPYTPAHGSSARGTRETTGALEARVLRELADATEARSHMSDLGPGFEPVRVTPLLSVEWLRAEADKRDGTAGAGKGETTP